MNISVSVIVLTYKQPEVLKLIIESLNQQTYSGNVEVIVADDGSPNLLATMNIMATTKSTHPIKYVWHTDLGFRAATARNNGICLAQNELLIFLDGDIVPYEDLIEKHVAQHQEPKQLVAGNRTWLGEQSDIDALNNLERVVPDAAALRRGQTENMYRHKLLSSQHPWRACFSANLSLRKSSFVLFDERFIGWGPEDAEFCYRMCVKHGLTPIYDETIGSYHLESPDAVGNVFRKNNHSDIVDYIRNTFLFFDNCPGLDLEDAFYGFRRLVLNKDTNRWSAIPRSEVEECDLGKIVGITREWINRNKTP